MVDTDQEKEAQSILSAKSRNHSVEEKEEEKKEKRKKKKKEKRKRKNEFVLHELTKTVLKLHSTKWSAKSWGALIQRLCSFLAASGGF